MVHQGRFSGGGDPDSIRFALQASLMRGLGDRGSLFPGSDVADMGNGAQHIPNEVTLARRGGQTVRFVQDCQFACCWYWLFADQSRIYHHDPRSSGRIARANNGEEWTQESGVPVGPCPQCDNERTNGETVAPDGTVR